MLHIHTHTSLHNHKQLKEISGVLKCYCKGYESILKLLAQMLSHTLVHSSSKSVPSSLTAAGVERLWVAQKDEVARFRSPQGINLMEQEVVSPISTQSSKSHSKSFKQRSGETLLCMN